MILHWKNLLRLFLAFVLLSNAVATSAAMTGHHGAMGKAMQSTAAAHSHNGSMAHHTHEGHEHMGAKHHMHDAQDQDDQAGPHAADNCCQAGACCPVIGTSYQFTLNHFRAHPLVAYDSSFEMIALAGEIKPPRKLHA
jgi:hypothetical protein